MDTRIMVTIAVDFMIASKLRDRKQGEEIKQWQRSLFVSLFTYTKLFLLHNIKKKIQIFLFCSLLFYSHNFVRTYA